MSFLIAQVKKELYEYQRVNPGLNEPYSNEDIFFFKWNTLTGNFMKDTKEDANNQWCPTVSSSVSITWDFHAYTRIAYWLTQENKLFLKNVIPKISYNLPFSWAMICLRGQHLPLSDGGATDRCPLWCSPSVILATRKHVLKGKVDIHWEGWSGQNLQQGWWVRDRDSSQSVQSLSCPSEIEMFFRSKEEN